MAAGICNVTNKIKHKVVLKFNTYILIIKFSIFVSNSLKFMDIWQEMTFFFSKLFTSYQFPLLHILSSTFLRVNSEYYTDAEFYIQQHTLEKDIDNVNFLSFFHYVLTSEEDVRWGTCIYLTLILHMASGV